GVDEAGEQRGVAEIDDLGVGRNGAADRLDPAVLDDHDGIARDGVGGAVEHARGLEDDGLRWLGEGGGGGEKKRGSVRSHVPESSTAGVRAILRGRILRRAQHAPTLWASVNKEVWMKDSARAFLWCMSLFAAQAFRAHGNGKLQISASSVD